MEPVGADFSVSFIQAGVKPGWQKKQATVQIWQAEFGGQNNPKTLFFNRQKSRERNAGTLTQKTSRSGTEGKRNTRRTTGETY